MNELGLAGGFQKQSQPTISIDDVIMMLKQGTTIDELIAIGVPQDILEQAIVALEREMSRGNPQNQMGIVGGFNGQEG